MLTFGGLLDLAGIERSTVRLLRHQERGMAGHHSPYALWRDHPDLFLTYQETQALGDEARLRAHY